MTWQDQAACKGMDVNVFYPSENQDRNLKQQARIVYAAARVVCMTCPVRVQCLEGALANRELAYGMFGGLAPDERRNLVRSRRRHGTGDTAVRFGAAAVAVCGTTSGYRRHLDNGEPTCPDCRQAASESLSRWRRKRRAQQEATS